MYNLPVYLRTFYYKKLHEAKEKEKEQYDKANKGKGQSTGKPNIPSFARNSPKK